MTKIDVLEALKQKYPTLKTEVAENSPKITITTCQALKKLLIITLISKKSGFILKTRRDMTIEEGEMFHTLTELMEILKRHIPEVTKAKQVSLFD